MSLDLDAIRADLDWLGTADWRVEGTNQAIARVARVHGAARDLLAEVERLRANQLPEGGAWITQYRHRNAPGEDPVDDWRTYEPEPGGHGAECEANGCEKRRVYHWTGPAEPIGGAE